MAIHENTIVVRYFKSKIGELIVGVYDNTLCLCDWRYRKMRASIDNRIQKGLNASFVIGDSELINETIHQLTEYFSGERRSFDIPLNLIGSDFQVQVWNELLKIPYGESETYLGLSKRMNNKDAIRAVASANGANAISIIVPCHRIIGSNGKLVGYAGGLEAKKKLLLLEGGDNNSQQMSLFN